MRRSITGPLFIIAIGSLLLAQNLYADFSIWNAFAEHWPWLLVAWGGLRLAEHGLRAAQGEPGPPPMRAGALIPALLLCTVGSAAHGIERADWKGDFDLFWGGLNKLEPAHSIPVEGSWPASGIETLEIDGYLGDIRIVGDDEDSIRLEGHRKIAADSLEQARRDSDTSPIAYAATDGVARLSPSGGPQRRFSGDFVVRAPRSLVVRVTGGDGELKLRNFNSEATVEGSGEVDVEDLSGSLTVRLRHGRKIEARRVGGDLTLEGAANSVEAHEVSGTVKLTGDQYGRLEITAAGALEVSGRRLEIRAPDGIVGKLKAADRKLEIFGVPGALDVTTRERWRMKASSLGGPTRLTGRSGDVEVELGEDDRIHDLEVRIESGDILLRVPPDGDFDLEARARDIDSALPRSAGESGGDGSARIQLRTDDGRIRLEPPTVDNSER